MVRSVESRAGLLLAVAAGPVTVVRYLLQYGHAPWKNGLIEFAVVWFLHYIFLAVVAACVLLSRTRVEAWVSRGASDGAADTTSQVILDVALVCFWAATAALVVAFFGLGYSSYLPEF